MIIRLPIVENMNRKTHFHYVSLFQFLINWGLKINRNISHFTDKTTTLFNCRPHRYWVFGPITVASGN